MEEKSLKSEQEKEIDRALTKIMLRLGLFPNYSGYSVFKEAVYYTMKNKNAPICKEVYPYIGNKNSSNSAVVERNIRHMIQTAYDNGTLININEVFGIIVLKKYQKIGNRCLIKLLAEHLLTVFDLED